LFLIQLSVFVCRASSTTPQKNGPFLIKKKGLGDHFYEKKGTVRDQLSIKIGTSFILYHIERQLDEKMIQFFLTILFFYKFELLITIKTPYDEAG